MRYMQNRSPDSEAAFDVCVPGKDARTYAIADCQETLVRETGEGDERLTRYVIDDYVEFPPGSEAHVHNGNGSAQIEVAAVEHRPGAFNPITVFRCWN